MLSVPLSGRGLIRSLTHSLTGDPSSLPDEGALSSFDGATGWLNSEPLTPAGLRGRVVLVDFWTYTCVNWLRTLPYIRAWADKYADAGLTVVGVHTPEFGFEHNRDNVIALANAFGVTWPIALDNDYAVWSAFSNHYWPAVYLADGDGTVRYHHFGEGEYAATEMAIQQLMLDAGAQDLDLDLVMVDPHGLEVAADWPNVRSPETYTGHRQSSGFAQDDNAQYDEPASYASPAELRLNDWALSGTWTVGEHAAIANDVSGRVVVQFHARDLNLVMGPGAGSAPVPFRVFLDGPPAAEHAGSDVSSDSQGIVDAQRTYQLIRQAGPISSRRFEIEFADAGVEVYCFTFG